MALAFRLGEALGILGVAGVVAGLPKLAHVLLSCFLEEGRFVEAAFAIEGGGVGHQAEVTEPDLAALQRLHALRHGAQAEPDANVLAGDPRWQPGLFAEPLDGVV